MAFISCLSVDTTKLKCALCQNYLSVPPIMVISESGDHNKCGRCLSVKTPVNIRNKIFEDLVKLAKFSCIYKNCKEELLWGSVGIHEQICPHKTYRCNFIKCSDVVAIDDLENHYIIKHDSVGIVHEKLVVNLHLGYSNRYVLIKNKVPYLVYYNASRQNFWIAVFSIKSKLTKYEVTLSTTNSNMSVQFKNGTVTPYNEREHCPNCMFGDCPLPHHTFSNIINKVVGLYSTNSLEGSAMFKSLQITNISISQITPLLGCDKLICTVNIVDEPETPEITEPRLVTVKEPNSCNNNRLLQQILQCPICLEFMPAEIYTCKTGHVICNNCKPQLKECPTCKEEYAGCRSFALEEIAEKVELACQHEGQGCNFIGNVANVHRHQAQCSYKNSK